MEISGHSCSHLRRIILANLEHTPPLPEDLSGHAHLIFDGKFLFGRSNSLIVLLDATTHTPLAGKVVPSESGKYIQPWLEGLRQAGLNPTSVTLDGKPGVERAFQNVWPTIQTQRCIFHLVLQTVAWLRAKPRYASAKALKSLVLTLPAVTTYTQALFFQQQYEQLLTRHQEELSQLDPTHPIQSDVLKAYTLIGNALPQTFTYLTDSAIAPTTSALEGYFKQVQKIKGFIHNGLTRPHLFQFLCWRIYFDL